MDGGEEPLAKRQRADAPGDAGGGDNNAATTDSAAADWEAAVRQLPAPGHRLALPDGWLDCPAVGRKLVCSHLLPCKVPLGQQFNAVLAGPLQSRRFTPADALRAVEALPVPPGAPQPRAVAVIDLTKTERYYTPEAEGLATLRSPGDGVKHIKLPCAGSDGPPTPGEVNQFMYWVEVLLDDAQRTLRAANCWPVILVHCTHGFNRTGAMLVHYAMRCRGARPDLVKHLAKFAECRPPGIYKDGYISGLFDYYHDIRPMPPHAVCPPEPPWKRQQPSLFGGVSAPPLADSHVPAGDLWGADNESYMAATAVSHVRLPDEAGAAAAAAAQSAPLQGAEAGGAEMHHDDVLGENVPPELELSVRGIIMQLVARDRDTEPTAGQAMGEFPGAQPVSLMRGDCRALLCDPALDYRVSWKADGTRYLLLLLHGGAYLLNRAARVRRVQLRFPGPECEGGRAHKPLRTLDYTLLDGEMVVDTLPGEPGRRVRRFLAYDLCSYRRDSPDPGTGQLTQLLCSCPWRERVAVLADKVVRPKRLYEEAAGPGRYRADAEPFRVRVKDFYPLARSEWVLRKWMPTLTHPSDGLVFQAGSAPYVGHTDERLFKWKFPELNTVDFQVVRDPNTPDGLPLLCVADSSGGLKDLACVALPPEVATDARGVCPTTAEFRTDAGEPGEVLCEDDVAEFRWDAQAGQWSFLRVRRDKHHPNHESVFIKVWRSIWDGITAQELLDMLPRPETHE